MDTLGKHNFHYSNTTGNTVLLHSQLKVMLSSSPGLLPFPFFYHLFSRPSVAFGLMPLALFNASDLRKIFGALNMNHTE